VDLFRVGGATVNQTPLDFTGNARRIRALLEEAKAAGVALLCLPELTLSGYGCEDAFFSLSTARMAEAALLELLPATKGITAVIGLPHFYYGAMYNCAVMVQDGAVLGVNAKRVLPKEGVHYEPRWFRPWPFGKVVQTTLCGSRVPLGDVRYRLGSIGVAVEICEEAWDAVPASAAHADAVDLIVNPSASHFALGKYARREHLVANSSRSLQVSYLYTNLVGCEAGRMIYDGGVLFAEGGEIVARGRRFGFSDGEVIWRDVNPEQARVAKLRGKPVRGESDAPPPGGTGFPGQMPSEVLGADPRVVARQGGKPAGGKAAPAYDTLTRDEEFLQAEMLGLFDYQRKAGAKGYVVSLSGGCDSSACATLVAHMVAAACAELGATGAAARLGVALPSGQSSADPKALVRSLLTCVYQRTAQSGAVTEKAATEVAKALGAAFHVVDVQPMVDGFLSAAASALGRPLTWQRDDLSLQNIQARTRSPLAWLLANVEGKILLTTSNRSEAAVGYATMDGDTSGGLAPLAGIDKHFLRAWLRWAETRCRTGLGPIAALGLVNAQQPTAELRPHTSGAAPQTDEGDLMPYEVLDRIERLLVRDRLGPEDIAATIAAEFPLASDAVRRGWLDRFFRLWALSQWKRERYAPSFHLDDESLDPKTWCRFPILSKPYELP
jgi:NAD+ synthase (glutamine-hydrolysing)